MFVLRWSEVSNIASCFLGKLYFVPFLPPIRNSTTYERGYIIDPNRMAELANPANMWSHVCYIYGFSIAYMGLIAASSSSDTYPKLEDKSDDEMENDAVGDVAED